MAKVPVGDQPTTPNEAERARALLARARGGTAARPVGPPRTDTRRFDQVVDQEMSPGARPGIPTMHPGELQQRLQTGEAVPGVGSAYPDNQPGAPRRATGLRKETVEGLEALAAAQKAPPAPAPAAPPDEEEMPEVDEESGISAEEVEATLRVLKGNTVYSPIRALFTNERRVELEKSLTKLSISDILINQDARQQVPITEGLYITYRSLNGHETDYIEKFIWERFQGDLTQQMYAMTRSLVAMTLAIIAIGKQKMPECRTDGGDIDDKLFATKWKAVLRWPGFILEAADINRVWFEERCSKLLDVRAVGNG